MAYPTVKTLLEFLKKKPDSGIYINLKKITYFHVKFDSKTEQKFYIVNSKEYFNNLDFNDDGTPYNVSDAIKILEILVITQPNSYVTINRHLFSLSNYFSPDGDSIKFIKSNKRWYETDLNPFNDKKKITLLRKQFSSYIEFILKEMSGHINLIEKWSNKFLPKELTIYCFVDRAFIGIKEVRKKFEHHTELLLEIFPQDKRNVKVCYNISYLFES